ncbi:ssDNA-binding protein, mitochondrial [Trapelia coarctata]|nr:ssDNA-binding protein, mitochondrial [Trapelia coarctata]
MPALRPTPLFRSFRASTARAFSTTPSSQVAKITLVGRLAAEPELTSTSTGQDMVRYSLATSYGPKENRQTSWWRVASFAEEGKGRERLLGLGKGTLVYVEGDASMRKYESKEGKTESALSIVQRSCRAYPFRLGRQSTNMFLSRIEKLEILKRPDQQSPAEDQMQQE